jgi:hypothetical protein
MKPTDGGDDNNNDDKENRNGGGGGGGGHVFDKPLTRKELRRKEFRASLRGLTSE